MAEILEEKVVRGIGAGQALAVDDGLSLAPGEFFSSDPLAAEAYSLSREVIREAEQLTGAQQEIVGQVAALAVIARRNSPIRVVAQQLRRALQSLWEVIDDGWTP